MDYLKVQGGVSLCGEVQISGAKNAALPLIAMSILAKNGVEISNLPDVTDIKTLIKLLEILGAKAEISQNKAFLDTKNINATKATYDIVRKMRASMGIARFRFLEGARSGLGRLICTFVRLKKWVQQSL